MPHGTVVMCGEFWSGQPSAACLCVKLAASSHPASGLFGKLGSTPDPFPHKQTRTATPAPPPTPTCDQPVTRRKIKRIYIKLGGCLKAVDLK